MAWYEFAMGIFTIIIIAFFWVIFTDVNQKIGDRFTTMTKDTHGDITKEDVNKQFGYAGNVMYASFFFIVIIVILWIIRKTTSEGEININQ